MVRIGQDAWEKRVTIPTLRWRRAFHIYFWFYLWRDEFLPMRMFAKEVTPVALRKPAPQRRFHETRPELSDFSNWPGVANF